MSERGEGSGPEAAEDPFPPGTAIDGLIITRPLGHGTQGLVYEAREPALHRDVAVKILQRDLMLSFEKADRFWREAEAAARLNHPGIVAVYRTLEWQGHRAIVQELVRGSSLEARVAQRARDSLPVDAAWCRFATDVCRQMARALEHAHARKVLHRDVKPANILVADDGTAKLADFGLARVQDRTRLTATGAAVGTLHYMSPEQVRGDDEPDGRADVYALGAVLYRLLALRTPFTQREPAALLRDILTRDPAPLRRQQPAVSAELEAVCLRALRKAPESRFATAGEMADELERVLAGRPTATRPISRLARSLGVVRRWGAPALLLAIGAVAAAWALADVLLVRGAPVPEGPPVLRLATLAAFASLACWPAMLAGRRLLRGRPAGTFAGAAVVIAVVAFGAWRFIEDAAVARWKDRHAALQATIGALPHRRGTEDIDAYVAEFGDRFGATDDVLVARAYYARGRTLEAAAWAAGRPGFALEGRPFVRAMKAVLAEAEGRVVEADVWLARLNDSADDPGAWDDWVLVGDVLFEAGMIEQALKAYEQATQRPDPPRDVVYLRLAQAQVECGNFEDARRTLVSPTHWGERTPLGLRLLLGIELRGNPKALDDAERLVGLLEARADVPLVDRLVARYQLLCMRSWQEAVDWVRSAYADHSGDPEIVSWCAESLYGLSRLDESPALMEEVRLIYSQWHALAPDAAAAFVGMGAVDFRLSRLQPDSDKARSLLEVAIADADRAIELDPNLGEAFYNRGTARAVLTRLVHDVKTLAGRPADELRPVAHDFRDAAERNGTHADALIRAAFYLGELAVVAPDENAAAGALEMGRRAVRLTDPKRRGATCGPSQELLAQHSEARDTLFVLEQRADLQPASPR